MADKSGSMTTGGTSKALVAANEYRECLIIQNPSTNTGQGIATAEVLHVKIDGGTAGINTGVSFEIAPGGSLTLDATTGNLRRRAISVNAATTAHKWVAWEE